MTVVNTEGLAFFGPGSEWFWAAAQFVVVVVTLAAIYRQLRSQAAANFVHRIETLGSRWDSPRMTYSRLELALHLRYEQPDLICFYKACPVLDFFADLHNLNVEGYIGIKEIEANWGKAIQMWTALTAPVVALRRQEPGRENVYRLEPLIAKLRKQERGNRLSDRLRALLAKLRRQEDLNTTRLIYGSEAANAELDDSIRRATTFLKQEAAWRSEAIPMPPGAST